MTDHTDRQHPQALIEKVEAAYLSSYGQGPADDYLARQRSGIIAAIDAVQAFDQCQHAPGEGADWSNAAIGRRIKEERKRSGLTQTQVGALLQPSVSYAAVSDIERGKVSMSIERVAELASLLNTSVPHLIGLTPTTTDRHAPVSDEDLLREFNEAANDAVEQSGCDEESDPDCVYLGTLAGIRAVRERLAGHGAGEVELRETVEDLTRQFAYETVKNGVPCLWTGGLSALEGAFTVLGWADPHPCPENTCEHPGCTEWATCGTPTPDGYKRVCGDHYRAALTPDPDGGET